jgi:predicted NUDIX family NTP pyrophosphohydrolase
VQFARWRFNKKFFNLIVNKVHVITLNTEQNFHHTMGKKQSAGIVLFKVKKDELMIFLVHPGGPFWKKKDDGAWSIPKGEFDEDENALEAAKREFNEETGYILSGDFIELTPVKQKSGKIVHAWALEKDIDADTIKSNSFTIEWPPKSNKMVAYPEIDKAAWFTADEAKMKINPAQVPLIDELEKLKN